jgi:hypothetical protein
MKLSVARFLGNPGASDVPWVLLYSAVVAFLILAWAYVPA